MLLSPTMQTFILHWGEMGSRWGVNRTVAQIHALLYLVGEPLTAEKITDTLGVARSNVSTSLRELQSWGLVQVSQKLGDRRDYFASQQEVWDIFMTIMEGRKQRELDPTLTTLRNCALEGEKDPETPTEVQARIDDTLVFLEQLLDWYGQMKSVDRNTLIKLMKLGARIQGLMGK
ncbi:MAG: MarR family transcriptional regulator [Oceanospirillales bacterium]|nr:MarR family transcriptional regulator [Oceanospirillales bacterium]